MVSFSLMPSDDHTRNASAKASQSMMVPDFKVYCVLALSNLNHFQLKSLRYKIQDPKCYYHS